MSWISDKAEKFRQVPNPYLSLHITGKFLFGVGLGVLLGWLAANMDCLDFRYYGSGNSYSKCRNCSLEVRR